MKFEFNIKKKIILILVVINIFVVGVGVAYSSYRSSSSGNIELNSIAKIVFNNQVTQGLSFPSNGLMPGGSASYLFKVSNFDNNARSDVNIDYSIKIETFHFLPTVIKLYKVNGVNETLIVTCDESTGTRDSQNKLVCISPVSVLFYSANTEDNYKIVIDFPSTNNGSPWSYDYSEVIDFVDVTIISDQKTD